MWISISDSNEFSVLPDDLAVDNLLTTGGKGVHLENWPSWDHCVNLQRDFWGRDQEIHWFSKRGTGKAYRLRGPGHQAVKEFLDLESI